ncbi:alpha/beta hydrolase family esterase [Bradyrhizobium sp. DASA03005]|uniref:extracellular catalytic domain type 1 short-chain-length polyhydroxyalkanoate depolymerase n=1 Tax=Bradyrhizobium TaxID=374 RepID=UPI00155F503D|nr:MULTISPECIES: PHB depolymerase family esterase [Bradyrhizobium]MBR1165749.1 PHB depolymerase family esterase [Bradyrhizobium liaoningense]MDD1517276.1 esterase [Bradyrhizobium sp. WBAH30]MDD1541585.1 esterase [Bradyrhizobium sp. WBAH41]MDD1555549.1 esterase [Bradyrhizobium sp. WBAH23]MDD1564380.1 esterase [Bradyrhizobium sp. WBAH33]
MLNQDIVREATRLTRAGQLVEATALLQRMLQGGYAPRPESRSAAQARLPLDPLTIDATADVVEEREAPPISPARSAQGRRRALPLDGMRDFPGVGLRSPITRAPLSPSDIVPEGTQFIAGTFSNAAGSRTYKLFIPSRFQGQRPLIVMLHGCTQSPDDFAAGTRMNFLAEEQNCYVVYPEQPSGANQSKCWNWFRTGDQRRGGGEPSMIAGITRQIMREHPIDPKRVYVAGLSAGGAAAAIMGATYNDLYAAVGIHSGLACGAASDLPSAFVAMRQGGGSKANADGKTSVPTIVFHGNRDTTVHPKNGDQIIEQSARATRPTTKVLRGRVPHGHAYTRTVLIDGAGRAISEHWDIDGAGHAWSGGSPAGSYTDPQGPDATREMLRFFLEHSLGG